MAEAASCRWCDVTFSSTHPSRVYCSADCGARAGLARGRAKRAARPPRSGPCRQCGVEFTYPTHRAQTYCSAACRARAKSLRLGRRPLAARQTAKPTATAAKTPKPRVSEAQTAKKVASDPAKRRRSRTLFDEAVQYVPDVVVSLDPALARRAALTVALLAVDARERADLLDMLGILDVFRRAPDVDAGSDRPADVPTGLAGC